MLSLFVRTVMPGNSTPPDGYIAGRAAFDLKKQRVVKDRTVSRHQSVETHRRLLQSSPDTSHAMQGPTKDPGFPLIISKVEAATKKIFNTCALPRRWIFIIDPKSFVTFEKIPAGRRGRTGRHGKPCKAPRPHQLEENGIPARFGALHVNRSGAKKRGIRGGGSPHPTNGIIQLQSLRGGRRQLKLEGKTRMKRHRKIAIDLTLVPTDKERLHGKATRSTNAEEPWKRQVHRRSSVK